MTEPRQPLRDQPPEVLEKKLFNAKSDTFSFGVAIWAFANGTKPWPALSPMAAARKHISGERLPPVCGGLGDAAGLNRIMQRCWAHENQARPAMKEVHDAIAERLVVLQQAGGRDEKHGDSAKDPGAGGASAAVNRAALAFPAKSLGAVVDEAAPEDEEDNYDVYDAYYRAMDEQGRTPASAAIADDSDSSDLGAIDQDMGGFANDSDSSDIGDFDRGMKAGALGRSAPLVAVANPVAATEMVALHVSSDQAHSDELAAL